MATSYLRMVALQDPTRIFCGLCDWEYRARAGQVIDRTTKPLPLHCGETVTVDEGLIMELPDPEAAQEIDG